MNLQIRHLTPVPPTPTCYISLSTEIAASLSSLRPYSSLTIIKLTPHLPSSSPSVYLAWSASTTPHPNSLSLHPLFCASLLLPEFTAVTATISERVVNHAPRCIVKSATLRPYSYTLCNSQNPALDSFQTALHHFSLLSTSASVIERFVLEQISVIQIGLHFPLRLPAGEVITVCVLSMELTDINYTSFEYAVLQPGSELHIEPPPPMSPFMNDGVSARARVKRFVRVLPQSKVTVSAPMRKFIGTHAVLSGGQNGGIGDKEVVVSRKRGKGLGVPVRVIFDEGIGETFVSLPGCVWEGLGLQAFMPVFVEEVGGTGKGSGRVWIERGRISGDVGIVSWEQVVEERGIYWDGMAVREGRVRVGKRGKRMKERKKVWDEEVWDRVSVKVAEVLEPGEVDERFRGEGESMKEMIKVARANRNTKEGFRSFAGQESVYEDVIDDGYVEVVGGSDCESRRPLRREETKRHALVSLTKSGRYAIDSIANVARALYCREKDTSMGERNCRTVLVEGALGAGKTHTFKAVASFLRELANARTIWIRGKSHSGEQTEVSKARVKRAFQEAADGGPGLVVIDDVDMLCQNRKNGGAESEVRDPNTESGRLSLAQVIEDEISTWHPFPVLLLMSCENVTDLELNLRSPGIIRVVVELSLPTSRERSLLYWTALQDLNYLPPVGDDLPLVRKEVASLGFLSEGYSPKDIHISLKRTQIAICVHPLRENVQDLAQVIPILKGVLKKMTPASGAGFISSEAKEGETLSWSQIGGLESAKNTIWQVLQLPSIRPDIFSRAPIRLPHGLLLYGPPGCGKTLLARTAAAESGMHCVMVKGPELLSKYIGESEAEVRRAFSKAASSSPCVLLFDEFDSLAPRRGGESTGVADRVVNTLLTCMDGAERLSEGVYVMATTSRPELIDPALLRPGRLDKWVPIDVPSSMGERLDILRCLFSKFFESTPEINIVLQQLAVRTEGYTGADLGALLNDAHLAHVKQARRGGEEKKALPVPELISRALAESRPSLSPSQRDYFEYVMGKFNADEACADDASTSHVSDLLDRNDSVFGKRVALQ